MDDLSSPTTTAPDPSGRGSRPPARRGAGPARQEGVRRHNLALVLREVLDASRPVSRADVAAATGLTRATVSALVDRLVELQLVTELPPAAPQGAGRPAVPLAPAARAVVGLGLEVEVDQLGVRVVDLRGESVAERIERGSFRGSDPAAVLARLVALAAEVLGPLLAEGSRVAGAVLALPGLVDRGTGLLRTAPNLGWHDLDVPALLPALGGVVGPVRVANEADLAAHAEAYARRSDGGVGPDRDGPDRIGPDGASFVYVSGEVGVGGAVVLDGRLLPGRHGWAGEIGHTTLGTLGGEGGDGGGDGGSGTRRTGTTLEAVAGFEAMLSGAGLPPAADPSQLQDAVAAGPGPARDAVTRAGAALGVALANVVNVLDLGHVVLGGVYADLVDHLRPAVEAELRRRVISAPWSDVVVDAARVGPLPALTGAGLLALRDVLEDPASAAGLGR